VLHRPLALLSGLTLGDYLLWNWSLNGPLGGERDVLALLSGLTLPPLAIACLVLLALNLARLMARSTRSRVLALGRHPVADDDQEQPTHRSSGGAGRLDEVPASATSSSAPPHDKLAA